MSAMQSSTVSTDPASNSLRRSSRFIGSPTGEDRLIRLGNRTFARQPIRGQRLVKLGRRRRGGGRRGGRRGRRGARARRAAERPSRSSRPRPSPRSARAAPTPGSSTRASTPTSGELETQLILRSGELRRRVLERLGVPVIRCGALVRPAGEEEARTVARRARWSRGATASTATLRDDGSLEVPGEAVTDPVAYTQALVAAAVEAGAELRTGAPVEAIERDGDALAVSAADGDRGALPRGGQLRRPARRRGRPARRRRLASRSTLARASSSSSSRPAGSRSTGSCCPCRASAPRGCSCSRPSTARWSRAPPRTTRRTRTTGRSAPTRFGRGHAEGGAMLPALEGAEPIASYAGLRPAGRGLQLRDRRLARRCPG